MCRATMRLRRRQILCSLILAFSLLPMGLALAAEPTFASPNFKLKWERADKPIGDGVADPSRSWLWGPEAFDPTTGNSEPYADSPGGNRQVQYFDKARMEINNPANGLVTNGLLVRELISGRLATGDTTFKQRRPADDIPVAGDPTNNNGPTYASFVKVASLNGDNASAARLGERVSDTIAKDGKLGTDATLGEKAKYVYFDATLKHNIPDVFWIFLNQQGTIYQQGKMTAAQPVLGENAAAPWLDATGLPISEAYWTKVTLAGVSKDVLVQAFERRVLTFTPDNPAAFQVEMGNVGRHYFTWRYSTSYDITTPPTTMPKAIASSCSDLPDGSNGAFSLTKCGPAGMRAILATSAQVSETVAVTPIDPYGNVQPSFNIVTAGDSVASTNFDTLPQMPKGAWTFKFHAQKTGKDSITYLWLDPPVDKLTIIPVRRVGTIDDQFAFVVVGFKPNERISISLSAPDGTHGEAVGVLNANAGGGWTETFQPRRDFGYPSGQTAPTGQYGLAFMSYSDNSRWVSVTFTIK